MEPVLSMVDLFKCMPGQKTKVAYIFTECSKGLYGLNCQNNCSPNCAVFEQCDVRTGECIGGCQAGWTNSTCDESKKQKMIHPFCYKTL